MKFLYILIIFSISVIGHSQILDYDNRVDITLADNTQIVLYGAIQYDRKFSNVYYYLPTNLRLSQKVDDSQTPEFLFMKYTTEERESSGGVQGALIHFLMEWGLTDNQKREAELKLAETVKGLKARNPKYSNVVNPKIMGSVDVKPNGDNSFRIISATVNNNKGTLITSGIAPILPGSKVAVASKLEKNDAQLLAASFEKSRSITDLSVQLYFSYNISFPAIKASITTKWEQIQKTYERFRASGMNIPDQSCKDCDNDDKDEFVSDNVLHTFYDSLIKNESIVFNIFDNLGDERTQELVELFYSSFSNSIATAAHNQDLPPQQAMNTEENMKRYKNAEAWYINTKKIQKLVKGGTTSISLDVNISVPRTAPLAGNLAEWYDGVRHNKKCVNSINLNDPFYQYRDINFTLDGASIKLFDEEVNYVTMQVRKRRSNGNPFEKSLTINKAFLKDKGITANTTYARGEDNNPSVFEYKSQWSFKEGLTYPENPDWIQGDWESVTLSPPLVPKQIEFEASDLEKLKQMGFRRATLQLRYMKFGAETETNIPLTFSSGKQNIPKYIFIDKTTRGYVHRIILTHETEGKLILSDWQSSITDDYFLVPMNEELGDKKSTLFRESVNRARGSIASDGRVDVMNRILDRFKEAIDIISNSNKPPKR